MIILQFLIVICFTLPRIMSRRLEDELRLDVELMRNDDCSGTDTKVKADGNESSIFNSKHEIVKAVIIFRDENSRVIGRGVCKVPYSTCHFFGETSKNSVFFLIVRPRMLRFEDLDVNYRYFEEEMKMGNLKTNYEPKQSILYNLRDILMIKSVQFHGLYNLKVENDQCKNKVKQTIPSYGLYATILEPLPDATSKFDWKNSYFIPTQLGEFFITE